MKRLTGRNSDGSVYVNGVYGDRFNLLPGRDMPCNPTIQERLAAYEDTGLEPEDINAMRRKIEQSGDTHRENNEHLSNIVEALDWFRKRSIKCDECVKYYNSTCRGADAARCSAHRTAITVLDRYYRILSIISGN